MMTPEAFKKHMSLYGADLSRWPRDEVKPALRLIERDADIARFFAQMESLDSYLRAQTPLVVVTPALAARIAKEARRIPQDGAVVMPQSLRRMYMQGAGLFAAAVLGFVITFAGERVPQVSLMAASVEQQIIQGPGDDLG